MNSKGSYGQWAAFYSFIHSHVLAIQWKAGNWLHVCASLPTYASPNPTVSLKTYIAPLYVPGVVDFSIIASQKLTSEYHLRDKCHLPPDII